MKRGGIDLGGTKIEARLFDETGDVTLVSRRLPTPNDSYGAFLDALQAQIEWLMDQADTRDLPIGIAVPGILDPNTGCLFAANIVASGHAISVDLKARLGRDFPLINDCMAFALSEGCGGAGDGFHRVVGLILGTGVGAGICIDRCLQPRAGGLAVEIGHVAAPAALIARHGLPLFACGCGRRGCLETYVSGTGLANIAEHKLGMRLSAEVLIAKNHQNCLDIWGDFTAECLVTMQLTLAPDCIVLGGGVSNMPEIAEILEHKMADHLFTGLIPPKIAVAAHGDSSGARGAALLAVQSQPAARPIQPSFTGAPVFK